MMIFIYWVAQKVHLGKRLWGTNERTFWPTQYLSLILRIALEYLAVSNNPVKVTIRLIKSVNELNN